MHDEASDDKRVTDLARLLLRAGVGMVQYRGVGLSTRAMVERTTRLVRMTRACKVPLIIADRVDVALAVGADGVHVGAHDMPVGHARRLMGPSAIVGVTAPTPPEARLAEREGATYVSVGPVFASTSVAAGVVRGVEAVRAVCAATSLPICAQGGLNVDNLAQVAQEGVALFAVRSAVCEAADPHAAALELVRLAASLPHPGRPAL